MRRHRRTPEVMAISEHQLATMTSDLDQLHHDVGMPAMNAAIQQWTEKTRTNRRGFLIRCLIGSTRMRWRRVRQEWGCWH